MDSRGYDAGIPRHSVTGKHQCLGATTTITGANLVSIAVTPANSSMAVGATKQFTATGTFSDSSTQDVKCVCRLDQLWKAPLTPRQTALAIMPEWWLQENFPVSPLPELRNRIEFLERRCERIRQAPHGSGLELLVLRIEVEFVNPPRQMLRDLQISLDECAVYRQLCRLC